MDMLEHVQRERPRPIEKIDVARLRLQQVGGGNIFNQHANRSAVVGR
jgi:hypothetical protein